MINILVDSDDDFDGVSTYTGGDNGEEEDEATHNVCLHIDFGNYNICLLLTGLWNT